MITIITSARQFPIFNVEFEVYADVKNHYRHSRLGPNWPITTSGSWQLFQNWRQFFLFHEHIKTYQSAYHTNQIISTTETTPIKKYMSNFIFIDTGLICDEYNSIPAKGKQTSDWKFTHVIITCPKFKRRPLHLMVAIHECNIIMTAGLYYQQ